MNDQTNSSRIENAKRALLEDVRIRSDGKPITRSPLTRELILALLEQAGTEGMTSSEIAKEFPQRTSESPHILRSMEHQNKIVKLEGRYFLPQFAQR